MKLGARFYSNPDVVAVAGQLLGKVLFTDINGELTGGVITETEAYNGVIDKASHAFGGRRTNRTEIMYQKGGTAYIYLCYGIHSLFNVVTNIEGVPHAVLIRAILPYTGDNIMLSRRPPGTPAKVLYNGPGKVSTALGIHHTLSGISLLGNTLWIEDRKIEVPDNSVKITPRIGVDYAGEDALLPYRFVFNMK